MTKSFSAAAATAVILGLALAAAPAARADMLAIGYSVGNSPAITQIGASLNGYLAIGPTTYAPFKVAVTATGVPNLASPDLNTRVESIASTGPGTISIYITQDYVTTPLGPFDLQSGFTTNLFGTNVQSVTLSTYIDPTNGLFTHDAAHLASTTTFTAPSTNAVHKIAVTPNLIEPYSLTEVYTIVTTASAGDTSSTIDARDVPEPGSLALLATALLGMVMIGKRRTAGRR